MKRITILLLVLTGLFLASCSNVLTTASSGSDELAALDTSGIPTAPGVSDSRSLTTTHNASWLREARKEYLAVFFALIKHEQPVAAVFFPHNATFEVTSYDLSKVPLSGNYTGPLGVFSYLKALFKTMDIRNYTIQYQLADDTHVSSHLRLSATNRKTGKQVEMELVYVFTFGSNGRIADCRVYYDTQVWTRSFLTSSPAVLSDLRNETDDNKILTTSYDVGNLVKVLYDNFYAGNIPAVLPMLRPDVAIYFKGDKSTYPYAGYYTGIDGALQFVMDLAGTATPYHIDRYQITEGDRTDMVLFEEWTVHATQKSYHVNTVNSWRVASDGLLMGFSNCPDSLEIAQAYVP